MAKTESTETRLELENRGANEISEMLERYKNRLTVDNPRFIERYLNSELHLLAECGIDGTDVQFVAYFQREFGGLSSFKKRTSPEPFGRSPTARGGEMKFPQALDAQVLINSTSNSNKQAMLVDSIKTIENGQVLSIPLWSAIIRSGGRTLMPMPSALYVQSKRSAWTG
jgi:hypothetical protein